MTKQLDITFAIAARDKGIEEAVKHADQVHPNWSESALEYLKVFLAHRKSPFLCEDFREAAENVLPAPPSLRSYGAVILKAAKAGWVKKLGYAKVRNVKAHRTPANLWIRTQHALA